MGLVIGIAIVLIVFFSSNTIEKSLKSIETQNDRVIELLKEIRDKKSPTDYGLGLYFCC